MNLFKVLWAGRRVPGKDDDGVCQRRWHRGVEADHHNKRRRHIQQLSPPIHPSLCPDG